MKKNVTWNIRGFKNKTLDHCRQKFTKSDPKKDENSKNGTQKVLMTLTSFFLYFSESEDVTQLASEYGGYGSILNSLLIIQS